MQLVAIITIANCLPLSSTPLKQAFKFEITCHTAVKKYFCENMKRSMKQVGINIGQGIAFYKQVRVAVFVHPNFNECMDCTNKATPVYIRNQDLLPNSDLMWPQALLRQADKVDNNNFDAQLEFNSNVKWSFEDNIKAAITPDYFDFECKLINSDCVGSLAQRIRY